VLNVSPTSLLNHYTHEWQTANKLRKQLESYSSTLQGQNVDMATSLFHTPEGMFYTYHFLTDPQLSRPLPRKCRHISQTFSGGDHDQYLADDE